MSRSVKKLRILSICTSDTSGGAARAAYRIHQGVRALGVDSQMFVKNKASNDSTVHALSDFVPNNPFYSVIDWCATKVKNKIQHYYWNQYPHRDKNFKSDLRGTRLHGALQKLDYDILHLHWINQRFLSLDDLRKVNKPIVWTLHDSWPFCGICHYFLDCKGYQYQCGNCPQLGSSNPNDLSYQVWKHKIDVFSGLNLHIVSPSRWLADCARQSSMFRDLDISVIPNCLDTDLFRPLLSAEILTIAEHQQNAVVSSVLREATEKRLAKPLILFGAMNAANDRIKGFASLLSALQLLDIQGFCAHLVVFGANVQELPMKFKNIDVTFVGYIHDSSVLTALYNIADVTVVPSLTENLSCAIMESLSCATPVVAFNIGGNSDMIVHKYNGYLAKEQVPDDLANGIKWCLQNNINNIIGDKARNKVLSEFSSEIVCKKYSDLYKKLI